MKKPTSIDVARLAGVSRTTVSFVLNQVDHVSIPESTRNRVLDAAKQLGYEPPSRRNEASPLSSRLIGVVVPTLSNLIYPAWLQEIEEYAASKGYRIIVCNTQRKPENELEFIQILREKKVDGIIFVFSPYHTEAMEKVSLEIPLVNIAETSNRSSVSTIGLDSVKAGYLMARHLIDLGHRDIAYVSTPLTSISVSRIKRLEGIRMAMQEQGILDRLVIEAESHEHERYETTYEVETGRNLTRKILAEHRVTAIIGVNDMVAVGIMDAAKKQGFAIPEDLSVGGFDNIFLSTLSQPPLTTIDHHIYYRAKHAVDILLDKIVKVENQTGVFRVEYEPQLIIRGSTGNPRAGLY
ncbi:MAG TPA: LacI family DNA-binding transcriptional regulator [Spirochaetales bacterium]|nr:LacI family DNA-binding transcriptional regulator [Spirochaetales bacterium]